MRMKSLIYILSVLCALQLMACGASRHIEKQADIAKEANENIINDSILTSAHVGISVYNATDNKYLYNYQGDKYFIPASNTKIFTCYAAMKYLGDSLVGLRYKETDSSVIAFGTGDPSLLHPDFKNQPVFNFLSRQQKKIVLSLDHFQDENYGQGWSWDDYNDDYMVERNSLPIYGNIVTFHLESAANTPTGPHYAFKTVPTFFQKDIHFSADSEHIVFRGTYAGYSPRFILIKRAFSDNDFLIYPAGRAFSDVAIPFSTKKDISIKNLLEDTLHKMVSIGEESLFFQQYQSIPIHSQPTDSLLKIMMHRSDNFYAEQSLLMVSNEKLGVMNDKKIIDTLLSTDLKDLPQHPQWVDGSGLSRYNLFTPQDFVFMLNKMRNDFIWNRITTIFSTGGDGTLGNYYKGLKGKIFAKTGSLSNNIALSGYLITQKNKTIIFSVLVGNFMSSSTEVRKAVERFLTTVQQEN